MELSRLEKHILRFIRNSYPVAFNPSESKRVITHEERPIPVATDIRNRLNRYSEEAIDRATQRLITFQYISKVYLAVPEEDFSEHVRAPGEVIRHRILGPGAGDYGYQVTELGEHVIGEFMAESFKRWLGKLVGTLVEKCVLFILTFLLGMLLGWVLSTLKTRDNPKPVKLPQHTVQAVVRGSAATGTLLAREGGIE